MKAFLEEEALERGSDALAVELPFNQKAILEVRLDLKADTKTLMQFGSFMKEEALSGALAV